MENTPLISLITVNLNSGKLLEKTFNSVESQFYKDFEYILIDGLSTDESREIIRKNNYLFNNLIIEKDNGIYDAINKGIKIANGKYIILLHAGDYFFGRYSLESIKDLIINSKYTDILLSNVHVSDLAFRYREYPSSIFAISRLRYGIMPPHPGMIISRRVYKQVGLYSCKYKIASDFDMVVRIFNTKSIKYELIDRTFIVMIHGGVSDQLKNKIKLHKEIFEICRNNGIKTNHLLISLRFLIKIPGIVFKYIRIKKRLKKIS